MALSPQLLQFKSSGVYRLEFDKSQTANINVETLRLVVGHSRKGPYNTPVLIDTQETFDNVFGGIDKSLEKKGMFFHRSAIESLTRGPILALNIAAFTDGDEASYQALSTTGSVEGNVNKEGEEDYASFFDNDKFMTPSDTATLTAINAGDNKVLNFVNIKQDSITIIARQAADVAEFDMTAREWYGQGNVPEYLNEFDKMSDFMLDIFVFKGEFDAATMSSDPIYKPYFGNNGEGLRVESLDAFANLREVTLLAQYTGSILPGFKDLEGRNLYIESIVNAEARRTGLFCAVNEDAVLEENGTKVDFVGHVVDADEDFELLSHVVDQDITSDHTLNTYGALTAGNNVVDNTNPLAATLLINEVPESVQQVALIDQEDHFLKATILGEYTKVSGVSDWTKDWDAGVSTTVTLTVPGAATIVDNNTASTYTLTVLNENVSGSVSSGDFLQSDAGDFHTKITNVQVQQVQGGSHTIITCDAPIHLDYDGLSASDDIDLYDSKYVVDFGHFTITCDEAISTDYEGIDDIDLYHIVNSRVFDEDFSTNSGVYAANPGSDNFTVTYSTTSAITFPLTVGLYVDSATTDRLAKITRIAKEVTSTDTIFTVYCDIEPDYANRYIKSFADASSYYKTFVLPKANVAVKTITEYLNSLAGGTGLYDALIDKDIIDFRYVVDTFASHDASGINNKRNLSLLAKDRENAAAILNAPTVADFKLSTNPSFKDENGTFKTQYIETGGNLDQNPTSLYTLPSISEGANYAFYYGPGLIIDDNGKDLIVPPAAYVANNYIDKYTNALPWSIVAGPRRGVVSGANVKGVEYSFDKNDRDILEPFGINPIVFQRGVGLTILGNKTAQQSIKSALSSAHVREVLIYIQDGMANILKDYVFEFNNVQTRLEIKTLADSFMESVKQDGGVFEYRNIMDQTNNTNEVIDNNMGIIDTYVEPVKGLEIVVHRTTILNTGDIQSGNLG